MKRTILTAMIAGLLLAPATTLAQPDKHKQKHKHHGPPAAAWQHDRDHRDDHRRYEVRHDNGRHLGWYKQKWRRGEHVPVVYLQPRYYVDYRSYRLDAPPPGYGWVRPYPDSNEYLLVQLATGVISRVLGY